LYSMWPKHVSVPSNVLMVTPSHPTAVRFWSARKRNLFTGIHTRQYITYTPSNGISLKSCRKVVRNNRPCSRPTVTWLLLSETTTFSWWRCFTVTVNHRWQKTASLIMCWMAYPTGCMKRSLVSRRLWSSVRTTPCWLSSASTNRK